MRYNYMCRHFLRFFSVVYLSLMLSACSGDSPWRYSPDAPEQPSGLTAIAENGKISITWSAAKNAAAYNIYYSTSPAVSRSNGNKIATVVSTSYIMSGLNNDTIYYFAVTSFNSSSESTKSNEVSASPTAPGSFVQSDMDGTWNFNILVSGEGAGWMRGKIAVDNVGTVTFSSFLNSAGETLPPANLLPKLLIKPDGQVRDTAMAQSGLQGIMASSRKIIVGNSSPENTARYLIVLQKQVPGVVFTDAGDIQGFGSGGGGGRRFVYNQISSGPIQEWEFAAGQMGRDQKVQYSAFMAPSNPAKPADKASIFSISPDGIVKESLAGTTPQPAVLIDRGVMSADKSMIVGTATDTSGTSPRYIMRIYQLVNIVASDPNTFASADLEGTYDFRTLMSSSTAWTASGALTINTSGVAAYSSCTDSTGDISLPAGFNLAVGADGNFSNATDPTLLGKLSYFKDILVMTKTDSPGGFSLSIALKR